MVDRLAGKLAAFVADESGATAIEYALIASGISIVIAATVNLVGPVLAQIFVDVVALF